MGSFPRDPSLHLCPTVLIVLIVLIVLVLSEAVLVLVLSEAVLVLVLETTGFVAAIVNREPACRCVAI
ncbi:MAG: hypothetical protein ACK6EB_36880 [Planctomyces sp.]